MTLAKTLAIVKKFRAQDDDDADRADGLLQPDLPFMAFRRFSADAKAAGVDGLIVVDLPPEHDDELCLPARDAGIDFIRLATPTTDDKRLPTVLNNISGFLYYVAIAGITGTRSAAIDGVAEAVTRLKKHTALPVAVGFGIKTPQQAAEIARVADAAVVGSALVDQLAANIGKPGLVDAVLADV